MKNERQCRWYDYPRLIDVEFFNPCHVTALVTYHTASNRSTLKLRIVDVNAQTDLLHELWEVINHGISELCCQHAIIGNVYTKGPRKEDVHIQLQQYSYGKTLFPTVVQLTIVYVPLTVNLSELVSTHMHFHILPASY
jgi:hypothetical protein